MTTLEMFKSLPAPDQELLAIYFVSGVCFILFSYVIFFCQYIKAMIRISISSLMFCVGFMFLSTGGKMMQGTEYNLMFITRWSVIICTGIAFWVVVEIIKWNKKKQEENVFKPG